MFQLKLLETFYESDWVEIDYFGTKIKVPSDTEYVYTDRYGHITAMASPVADENGYSFHPREYYIARCEYFGENEGKIGDWKESLLKLHNMREINDE